MPFGDAGGGLLARRELAAADHQTRRTGRKASYGSERRRGIVTWRRTRARKPCRARGCRRRQPGSLSVPSVFVRACPVCLTRGGGVRTTTMSSSSASKSAAEYLGGRRCLASRVRHVGLLQRMAVCSGANTLAPPAWLPPTTLRRCFPHPCWCLARAPHPARQARRVQNAQGGGGAAAGEPARSAARVCDRLVSASARRRGNVFHNGLALVAGTWARAW